MGRIIINADDYGADSQRNAGILIAVLCGLVSSVSALVTSTAGDSLFLLKSVRTLRKRLSVGLHVDLTSPMLTKYPSANLWEGPQIFNDKRNLWIKAVEGKLKLSLIREELEAQIATFKSKMGDLPDHLDSHNHVHIATPKLYNLFREVSSRHGIKNIRFPHDPFFAMDNHTSMRDCDKTQTETATIKLLSGLISEMRTSSYSDMLLYELSCRNLSRELSAASPATVGFIGTCYGHHKSYSELKRIWRYVLDAGSRDFELMVHPGLNLLVNSKNPFSAPDRAIELTILIMQKASDLTARVWKRRAPQIVSWKEI